MFFGRFPLDPREIFYKSSLSFAFVNLKPLVPGHVLVSPIRPVPRLSLLDQQEVIDLFLMVQKVSAAIEQAYSASSITIALQDGVDAGQTVEHVHVHIIPRRKGDWKNNDDIYDDLARSNLGRVEESERVARSIEEMEEEAKTLSSFFQ